MNMPLFIQRKLNRGKEPLRVYWWRSERDSGLRNFGDEVATDIISALWGRGCSWAPPERCELAATGSIIQILQRESANKKIKVWGSGFISAGPRDYYKNLNFLAVRGPLTLDRIKQTKRVVYGDPGLLANLVFSVSGKVKYKVGIVPHYKDLDDPCLEKFKSKQGYKIISPLQAPQKVAEDIASCELILSSSLHGLIFADSFGVPNYWMPMSDKVLGKSYKFRDYYLSTNRSLRSKPVSILEDESAIKDAINKYQPIHNLKRIQKELIHSFPNQQKIVGTPVKAIRAQAKKIAKRLYL